MRLLQRSDTGEITLTRDLHNELPPYAILSHSWGPDAEELTFQDITSGLGNEKAGYKKIRFCAEQAQQNGLQYCWVDTCCIDKSSSAELSESINSMYAWYRKSRVCYVYLNDVVVEDDPPWVLPADEHLEEDERNRLENSSFARSRWFTRGWTLQELLALKNIEFYDKNWTHLGNLKDLLAAVVHITKIDQQALDPATKCWDLSNICIARRMSWAAKRQTTRPEDQAYCLLGLFDVKMPLLYGEGACAFIRLQEEILRRTDEDSLLAWSVPRHLTWDGYGPEQLLAPSPAYFEGCEKLIRISWEPREEPWFMSNLGLTITMTLIPEDLTHCYAILDCRNEDVSDQLLALRAVVWGGNFGDDMKRLVPWFSSHYRIAKLTRQQLDIAKGVAITKSVTILRQANDDFEGRMLAAPVTVTLDVALDGQIARHAISIEDYYPSRAWDVCNKKLVVTEGSSAQRVAAVRLKFGRDRLLLILRWVCQHSLWYDTGMGEPTLVQCPGIQNMRSLIRQLPELLKDKRRVYRGPLEFRYMHRKEEQAPTDLLLRAYSTSKGLRRTTPKQSSSLAPVVEPELRSDTPSNAELDNSYQILEHKYRRED
jgi:hypothetical protein